MAYAKTGNDLQILPGQTFPVLINLLEREGNTLAGESLFLAALVVKGLKENPDERVLLEIYKFLHAYCSILGPLICFSETETDFILNHLCEQVRQVSKIPVTLLESNVSKKRKRAKADLNVESTTKLQVDPEFQSAAINALISILVTDPRTVSESTYKTLAKTVAEEVLDISVHRYVLEEMGCVYGDPKSRKLLYKLLELLAKYPYFPESRPLHIALNFFDEAAKWDVKDTEFNIPTFCRNALLTLQLITDPAIAPLVCYEECIIPLTVDATTETEQLPQINGQIEIASEKEPEPAKLKLFIPDAINIEVEIPCDELKTPLMMTPTLGANPELIYLSDNSGDGHVPTAIQEPQDVTVTEDLSETITEEMPEVSATETVNSNPVPTDVHHEKDTDNIIEEILSLGDFEYKE